MFDERKFKVIKIKQESGFQIVAETCILIVYRILTTLEHVNRHSTTLGDYIQCFVWGYQLIMRHMYHYYFYESR